MGSRDGVKRIHPAWQRHNRSLRTFNGNVLRWTRKLVPKILPRHETICITAMPKSGSTLLMEAAMRASGYFPHRLSDTLLQEQNLLESRILDSWSFDSISTTHSRATKINLERMIKYRIRPVVLVRNIYDVAVSMRDHVLRESIWNPTFNADPAFPDLSPERQLDAVIDLAVPWNLYFVAEWQRAEIDRLDLCYEDMIANPEQTLQTILDFYGVDKPRMDPATAWGQAADSGVTRKNVGRPGRGAAMFTDAQVQRVRDLAAHFPGTDFSGVGL